MTGDRHTAEATALIVVAHGERRTGASNRSLFAHVAELEKRLPELAVVTAAVLKGEPTFADAVSLAVAKGARRLLIYQLLMSDGYFGTQVLPRRIAECRFDEDLTVLEPLGLDPRFADLVLREATVEAELAGFEVAATHLLLVGHGSTRGDASARATSEVARRVAAHNAFASVGVAFLEQPPFIGNALAAQTGPVVVAGLFTGLGMHGWHDVPAAIQETGANAVYTGPLGAHAGVVDIIVAAVRGQGS